MTVRDHAFGYGYGAGIARLWAYLLANPRTNLMKLDLKKFEPVEISCQFVDTLGRKEMPNAFPLQASSARPGGASSS